MARVHPEQLAPLPVGWEATHSSPYNATFYHNKAESKSSWNHPYVDSAGAVSFEDEDDGLSGPTPGLTVSPSSDDAARSERLRPAGTPSSGAVDVEALARSERLRLGVGTSLDIQQAKVTDAIRAEDPRANCSGTETRSHSAHPSGVVVKGHGSGRSKLRHRAQCFLCGIKGGRLRCIRCGVRDVAGLQLALPGRAALRGSLAARCHLAAVHFLLWLTSGASLTAAILPALAAVQSSC